MVSFRCVAYSYVTYVPWYSSNSGKPIASPRFFVSVSAVRFTMRRFTWPFARHVVERTHPVVVPVAGRKAARGRSVRIARNSSSASGDGTNLTAAAAAAEAERLQQVQHKEPFWRRRVFGRAAEHRLQKWLGLSLLLGMVVLPVSWAIATSQRVASLKADQTNRRRARPSDDDADEGEWADIGRKVAKTRAEFVRLGITRETLLKSPRELTEEQLDFLLRVTGEEGEEEAAAAAAATTQKPCC
jgi:hypothetical protein